MYEVRLSGTYQVQYLVCVLVVDAKYMQMPIAPIAKVRTFVGWADFDVFIRFASTASYDAMIYKLDDMLALANFVALSLSDRHVLTGFAALSRADRLWCGVACLRDVDARGQHVLVRTCKKSHTKKKRKKIPKRLAGK